MKTTTMDRLTPAPRRPARASSGVLALALGLSFAWLGGCSKNDAPITGSASAPPVSLQCAWQPGHTYQIRLAMEQTTDIEPPDPIASGLHRVTFEQVCLITVTNAPGGQLRLDLEVVSLGMERSKANQISTGFDSEQGGEIFDDAGYVPVLKKLVGGKLRFHLSSDGRVVKTEGLSEWLERALGNPGSSSRSKRASGTNAVRLITTTTNADGSVRTITSFVRGPDPSGAPVPSGGAPVTPPAVVAPATAAGGTSLRSGVARTMRNFFTTDLFKQILEFNFLPTVPVRVGDQWQAQGDTPITGRGRPRYNANVKFVGWQRHQGTNCARLDVKGSIAQRASRASKQDGVITGVLWIDTGARFPAAAIFDKDAAFPSSSTALSPDTNEVANAAAPKRVHQHVGVYLLSMKPTGDPAVPPATAPPATAPPATAPPATAPPATAPPATAPPATAPPATAPAGSVPPAP